MRLCIALFLLQGALPASADLVARGEVIFFNETFDGNGRTCGTCHPAENNFTVDQEYIATLPDDDPLFVAEFAPALIFGDPANLDAEGRPQRFEHPELMRGFGLILLNADGMGDLENRFVLRGVPHTLGLRVSIEAPIDARAGPEDRTGWAGDGAPGRLRDFARAAVIQHFPKTMARSFDGPDPDFRLPTADELDALEAYLLSLGRQVELELRDGFPDTLRLRDPDAEAGKLLFRDGSPPGSFTCQACHGNAGGNVLSGDALPPGNRNFDTGIESFLHDRIDDGRPVDGGFGTNPAGFFNSLVAQPGFVNENFGDGTFNTTSIVEAADTAPFFHNNAIATLEQAIELYNTPEFMDADGRSIPFSPTEVFQVARFLRVINAIDNIESFALRYAGQAILELEREPNDEEALGRLLSLAIADTEDAHQVLEQGGLYVRQLHRAEQRFRQAMNGRKPDAVRIDEITRAMQRLDETLSLLRF